MTGAPDSRPDISDDQYRRLVEGVKDYAIYMLDRSGVVRSWNAGAKRFKGYEAGEIIGRHFSVFFTEEDRLAGLPERVLQVAREEGQSEQEGWRIRKDGARFWAHAIVDPLYGDDGEVIGFAKVTRDISDRLAAREKLRESEERFKLLVQSVTDYAIYMLDPQGVVTNWNMGAARLKGFQEHEIVGRHFSTFYTDEDRAAGKPGLALDMAARHGRYEQEGWRVRKDGSRFWANVVIDPIRNDRGEMLGYAKVTRDISERKAAQEEVERARAEAHHVQKMAAIAQLASGIAHDFNNLLTVVMGNLDLLKRAREERRPRLIDGALHAVEQARKLTGKLLAFSRSQPMFPDAIDLNALIAGMDDILSQSLRGDIRLEFDLADQLWPVEVDVSQIQVALINLAVNARDAMPHGGAFRIKTENLVMGHGRLSHAVAVSVSDDGVGIDADFLPRVFEPFFTTKEVGRGVGLGLSQVYGFAQQSGGSVDIRSEVGRGTTVTLYLPKAKTAENPAAGEAARSGEIDGRGLKILLVEDNLHVAEVAAALLTERGHAVEAAVNAEEALQFLARAPDFDLVFSDLVMPGELDGLALARQVRSTWPSMPVLLATGYSDAATRAKAEGFALITKPYRPDALASAIQQVVSQAAAVPSQGASNVVALARPGA
ncbi:hybrid sensor histidine kinase/response regulator [Alsobacter sp. SYSU BS001988]